MARPSTNVKEEYEVLSSSENHGAARSEFQKPLPSPFYVDTRASLPQRSLGVRRLGRFGVFLTFLFMAYFLGTHWLPLYSMFGHERAGEAAPLPPTFDNQLLFNGETARSNGTHDYKRTVLLVSIDGLRADYLDRGLTPHLLAISKKGIRARSMRPIFPTITFPNHWALMTGLYAESHGIVAHNFWDPVAQEEFHFNQVESAWKPFWWLGEPIWETAEKAGVPTANMMWPGPPRTASNISSKYFVPWKNNVPLDEKLAQILNWVDMPIEERPQLITVYEPSVDQAGHSTGPNSTRTNATLAAIDKFAQNVQLQIEARNLTNILDIIFVSDHGMTDTSAPELIYLDDYIGTDGVRHLEHIDWWPALGLRFVEGLSERQVLQLVEKLVTGAQMAGTFEVYARSDHYARAVAETMPERWHYNHNERIAPVWVVPKIGYAITTIARGDRMSLGSHGYDNTEPGMQAMFVAHGPFSHQAKMNAQIVAAATDACVFGCHGKKTKVTKKLPGWDATPLEATNESEEEYIMEPFANVEIYNLIVKLLGMDKKRGAQIAPNNGTVGFWDTYL